MPTLSHMRIELDGIGHILNDRRLKVPRYQRPYAWTEKNVHDLLSDLTEAQNRGEEEYFLGSIVTIGTDAERLEVVDGQQRLATVTILFAAIRDYFVKAGDLERASGIEIDYLLKKDTRTQELVAYLQLSEVDNDHFRKSVLHRSTESERANSRATRSSTKLIDVAASIAAKYIADLVVATSNPTETLMDLADYLTKNAKVILVQVADAANAFTIFETLNDRGLALAITDLIKNMLFSRAGGRIDEVQSQWMSMINALEDSGKDDISLDFIRHYWSSANSVTRKDDLFDSIRMKINSPQRAVDFASDLYRNANLYSSLINPDIDTWKKYGEHAYGQMAVLNTLGMVQIRPLLLAVLDAFTGEEVARVMRSAVSWSVRFLIVGGLGGGKIESEYSAKARDIRSGKITSARQLAEAMKGVVPSDVVFRSQFENAVVTKAVVARYYLRILEEVAAGDTNPPLIINQSTSAVNLEHILPQSPERAWGHIDADTAKAYFNRLGNLTLMQSRRNSEVQNSAFSVKKAQYIDEPFKLTQEMGRFSDWGVKDIENRQKRLANLAVTAWKL